MFPSAQVNTISEIIFIHRKKLTVSEKEFNQQVSQYAHVLRVLYVNNFSTTDRDTRDVGIRRWVVVSPFFWEGGSAGQTGEWGSL